MSYRAFVIDSACIFKAPTEITNVAISDYTRMLSGSPTPPPSLPEFMELHQLLKNCAKTVPGYTIERALADLSLVYDSSAAIPVASPIGQEIIDCMVTDTLDYLSSCHVPVIILANAGLTGEALRSEWEGPVIHYRDESEPAH